MTVPLRIIRALRSIVCAVGILALVVTATPLVRWWAMALAGPWEDPDGDTLVVLGGDFLDDGTIGQSSYWRTVYAARAFTSGHFRTVVLSGGPTDGVSVASSMKAFLQCYGVPTDAIRLEENSASTRENALFVKPLLGESPGTVVLMTSDYHMFRAGRAFVKAGITARQRPIPDALKQGSSWAGRWAVFLNLVRETAAIAYYMIRGWI